MKNFLRSKKVLLGVALVGAAALLVACGGGGDTSESGADPVAETERQQALGLFDKLPVSWAPAKIETVVGLGVQQGIPVTLTTTKALKNARIVFVPDLRNAVTVTPEVIPTLAAGQSATVTLTFAPKVTDVRKVIAGVVLLFDKNATVSRPLPVKVSLVKAADWPIVTSAQIAGIAVKSPPNWHTEFNERANSLRLQNVEILGPPSGDGLEREAIFRVARRAGLNPAMLPIGTWVTNNLEPALPTPVSARNSITVAGRSGVRVVYSEVGGNVAHIYLPSGKDIVEISYGIHSPSLIPGYEEILRTLQVTDK